MPSLDTVLNSGTLLRAAHGKVGTGVGVPQPLPEPNPASEKDDELKPIWHYQMDFMSNSGRPDRISNLTCRVRDMGFMKMPVCESIDWSAVSITARGSTFDLPLTSQFMVLSEYLDKGRVPDSGTGFWQLEMNLDQSFQNVFCYDLGPPETCTQPSPVKKEIHENANFMPDPDRPAMPVDGVCGTACTITLPNLYVVVVVSLVCCKEKNNFEPGGVLGAGRLYPLVQVMSNHPVEKLIAKVKLKRPSTLPRGHENMDGEEMLPELGSIFFADLNGSSVPVTWTETFSHYLLEPPVGSSYVMVDPAKPARTISGAVANAGARLAVQLPPMDQVVEKPVDLQKVAGQGEFDNLHTAPRMRAPKKIRDAYPGDATLQRIAMAPFCVHDCLHTHMRWGTGSSAKHVLGWDGFTPYRKAGAPLVPPNQKITITLLSPSEFIYTAEILPPGGAATVTAGQWQIVNHHGSAYALAVRIAGKAAKLALFALLQKIGEQQFADEGGTWAMFYWHLRYAKGFSHTVERVKVLDMTKARS